MSTETTRAVLDHHMKALNDGDIEAVMADYADDCVFINTTGTTIGAASLRAMFSKVPAGMVDHMEMLHSVAEGDIGYIVWRMANIPMGTDTFVVRDAKIVAQTVATYTGA